MMQAYSAGQNTTAGFSPLQQQSFNTAANMQVPGQYNAATGLNQAAGMGNLGTTEGAGLYGQMGAQAGASYGQNATNPNAVASYMNPYLQNTLQPSLQLLNQQYGMQNTANNAQATQAGAFGGSRMGVQNALTNQAQNLATNQLVGNAYNQAYNTANTNMQTAANLGIQGAQAGLAGIGAQQAGYNSAGAAGSNLSNIGTAQLGAQQSVAGLQNAYGAQQQQQQQNVLNAGAQNYSTMQAYPMQQLQQLEGLYTGAPTNTTTQNYQAAPSTVSQVAGLGMAGYGLSQLGSGSNPQSATPATKAKGGRIKAPDNRGGLDQLKSPVFEKFAEGGIVGFSDGGEVYNPSVYRRYAIAQAQKMGLDPKFVDSIFTVESHYNPKAKSPTGPEGIGQLATETGKAFGLDPNDRKDGFKNIDASLAFMKDLQSKYNNDPQKMAVAYNQGESFLNAHLKANEGRLIPDKLEKEEPKNYLKKLNDLLPFPAAHAEDIPREVPVAQTLGANEQVVSPQAPAQAPAQAPLYQGAQNAWNNVKQTASNVGTAVANPSKEGLLQLMPGLGENAYNIAGMPMDVGHQIAKVFGNTTPDDRIIGSSAYLKKKATEAGIRPAEPTDPAAKGYRTIGELVGLAINPVTATEGVASLAGRAGTLGKKAFNRISPTQGFTQEGLAALKAENNPVQASGQIPLRLTPPSAPIESGTTVPVTTGGQGVIEAQEALTRERLANQAADRLAASKVEQPLAPIQGLNDAEQAISPGADATANSTRLGAINSSGTNATMPSAAGAPSAMSGGPGSSGWGMDLGQDGLPGNTPAPVRDLSSPDTGVTKASATSSGLSPDFLTQLGFGLMAGKSPYALTNLGEAGLGALKEQQEAKKYNIEERKLAGLEALQQQQGKYYGAYADAIERGSKEKNLPMEAEKLVDAHMKEWIAANPLLKLQTGASDAEEKSARQEIYQRLNIPFTGGSSTIASKMGTDPLGLR